MDHKNLETVLNYAKDIISGKRIACKELIQAAQRFLSDLDDPRYELRAKDAEFCIGIIEKTFVHIKGTMKGKPFILEDWEKFIVYNVAGLYLKGTDERKYKEAFIFLPRKNSKTFFASALAWALSLLERNYFSVLYIIATKLDRALEAFNNILENLEAMGEKQNFRVLDNNSEHSINRSFYNSDGEKTGAIKIQALAADAKKADGLNANIIILDEIHAYKSANEYFVYKQAMKAYINKLLIGITTAGSNMNSFCYQRLQYCQKILNKEIEDEQYFIFITKADNPDDYTNPIEHEKANPNYNVTIRPVDIMAEALQAQNDPSARSEFLNKSLNIYTNTMSAYFDMGEVQFSNEEAEKNLKLLLKIPQDKPIPIETIAGLPVQWFGGADLSKMFDLTGACIYGRYEDIDITITHGFIPITQAKAKAEEDNIPFFWWKDQGWLTMTNSELVDYEEVVKWFKSMREKGFKIKAVAFDKYNSRDFVRSMEKQKFKMEEAGQQFWKKSEAFREIERKIKSKQFTYLSSKAFEYCISNVKANEDAEERIRFEKVSENFRIDLFDATVVAVKQAIIARDKNSKINTWF
ncbi:terminase large subunit [Bacillus sp. ISL-75]|uniref:terminase large subunit n=1 Tax=Bacillus sp. ISL-75 TaxID=2819137 RepID=UPI001BE73DCC|nr:terminase TerL endonuclease subunit [Bacillus sp. ISL-75]MBT2728388.1 terminase large subunit [Bacillus sp. ISL-75]